MNIPIEILNKIFSFLQSNTAPLINVEIIKYQHYINNRQYTESFSQYCLSSFGLFRTGNRYCPECHYKKDDMFVDFCDHCSLCDDCCYKKY
jgi:hypothetical protein